MQVIAGVSFPPLVPPPPFAEDLVAFYDATIASSMWQDTAGTTPAASGNPVGRWDDLSGNGRHATQPTSGNRPVRGTAGGLGSINTTGSNGMIIPSSVLLACGTAVTIFMIGCRDVGATGYKTLLDTTLRQVSLWGPDKYSTIMGIDGGQSTDITATTLGVMMIRASAGGQVAIRRNAGAEEVRGTGSGVLSQQISLGQNVSGGGTGWVGHYNVVLVYRQNWGATQQALIRAYLAARYGVS